MTALYCVSLYWMIQTITTVGYGDIGGQNNYERMFCCIIMIIGVISFSFANGSLAAIISQMDAQAGSYNEKLKILN